MNFSAIPNGASVFLDANVLVYHFSSHPALGQACTDLMARIAAQEIVGYLASHIISELAHRLMTIEASQRFGWRFQGIAYRLKQRPSDVTQLTRFQQAINDLSSSRIHLLLVDQSILLAAASVSRQTGLFSNDALTIAAMQAHGITNLASHDADFDRVGGIIRYGPV